LPFIDAGYIANHKVYEKEQRDKLNKSTFLRGNARFPTLTLRENQVTEIMSPTNFKELPTVKSKRRNTIHKNT